MKTSHLTRLGLFTAAALVLHIVESWLPNPFPIPGIRLGLANIVTVYAVYCFSVRETVLMLLARILLGGFFSGSWMSLAFSLAGGFCCLSAMLLLRRMIPLKHLWMSSLLGAVCHNIGQLAAATVLLGKGVLPYAPFLLLSGCLTGAFTGFCAGIAAERISSSDIQHDNSGF